MTIRAPIEKRNATAVQSRNNQGSLAYFLSNHFPTKIATIIGPPIQPLSFKKSSIPGCHHSTFALFSIAIIFIRLPTSLCQSTLLRKALLAERPLRANEFAFICKFVDSHSFANSYRTISIVSRNWLYVKQKWGAIDFLFKICYNRWFWRVVLFRKSRYVALWTNLLASGPMLSKLTSADEGIAQNCASNWRRQFKKISPPLAFKIPFSIQTVIYYGELKKRKKDPYSSETKTADKIEADFLLPK